MLVVSAKNNILYKTASSVLVDRKYMELAVQALHDAFELEKTG